MARVAAEREEVELAAVGILAVGADGVEVVSFKHCKGLVWVFCLGGHDGRILEQVLFKEIVVTPINESATEGSALCVLIVEYKEH